MRATCYVWLHRPNRKRTLPREVEGSIFREGKRDRPDAEWKSKGERNCGGGIKLLEGREERSERVRPSDVGGRGVIYYQRKGDRREAKIRALKTHQQKQRRVGEKKRAREHEWPWEKHQERTTFCKQGRFRAVVSAL